MKRALVVFGLAMAVGACGPRNYVVLLDNPGGGSGKVIVSNQKGRQVLDKSGDATTINRASRPPSSPWQLSVEKIGEVFYKAFGARPARAIRYTIYFKSGGTQVATESAGQYQSMLKDVGKRPGVDATVAGHADRTASDTQNEIVAMPPA